MEITQLQETKFKYNNVNPSIVERAFCRKLYKRLVELAPDGSAVDARVELTPSREYKVILEVHSECGSFQNEASHSSMTTAAKLANQKLMRELAAWKECRSLLS